VIGLGKKPRDEAHGDPGHPRLEQKQRQRARPFGRQVEMGIGRMMDAPRATGRIGHERGHQTGQGRRQIERAERENLDPENRPGQRRSEHRTEPGGHSAHQQQAAPAAGQPEPVDEAMGEASAQLDRRSFAPRRAAEQMGDQRAQHDQRRHGQRHPRARLVNLVEDEVVAPFRPRAEPAIEPGHPGPAQRQPPEQPWRGKAHPRDRIERPEEPGAGRADHQRHGHKGQRKSDPMTVKGKKSAHDSS
jgi:hypothetical protein